ncbi:hypothetical protein BOTBODRAFT_47772 [Botryobasidium botryosum FD-172 SS1]|uniref:Transmembrane protein n=1 Tax=Botryobasidium botryosum (strain FD-172 SS1) TaxID=930990 RepID=A0A067M0H1_BOTB1|nr:hypothetical protein BOTBODRAFT_47772 [Botryobasidium botryosum FD-172 SS1]
MFRFNLCALVLGCIFWCTQLARAQVSSNITCPAVYSWMDNAKGQSPCLVSAYLSGVCNDGSWSQYAVPTGDSANICRCNTVLFNLISACATCQGAPGSTWTNWTQNCAPNVTTYNTFPLEVPSGTSLPDWVYWSPATSNVFVPAEAQNFHLPQSQHKDVTGVIVGSVVGGVAFIALIVGAVIFFIRRRKAAQARTSRQVPAPGYPTRAARPLSQDLLMPPNIASQRSSFESPRNSLYSMASNPSTVPMIAVPVPRALRYDLHQHHAHQFYNNSPYSSNAPSPAPGSYRGLAEV